MPVDKESVHRMSELPNDGYKVVDEVEKEAIEYISSDSMEQKGEQPRLTHGAR